MRVVTRLFSKSPTGLIACLTLSIAGATFFLPAAAARIVGGNGVARITNSGTQKLVASENSRSKNWQVSNSSDSVTDSPLSIQATFDVNNNGDAADNNLGNGICDSSAAAGDQCTLRAAIQEANILFGDDAINFSITGTINLTGALPDITSNMTITGPGSSLLTVRRNTGGDYRIFFTNNRIVNISGLTITNGRTADSIGSAHAAPGGGIYQAGGAMELTDVVITGNSTGNGGTNTSSGSDQGGWGGFGGGINGSGSLTMTDCVVSGNTTGNGGNGGSAGSGGRGGGIFFSSGPLILQNVTISGNHTGNSGGPSGGNSGYGGGIFTEGSNTTLSLTNVTITNNTTGNTTASGDVGGGAGIYILSGSGTLTNSTVSNNHNGNANVSSGGFGGGGNGGGIFNNGTLTITNSLISGNSTGNGAVGGSGNVGGGLSNNFMLTVINTTVSGNSTGVGSSRGGGIYNGAALRLINCTVTGNSANNNIGNGVVGGGSLNSIRNTIIARNGPGGAGPDLDPGFFGTPFNSQGHNLIGNADGSTGFTGVGDQVGTGAAPVDPLLGPLANNGGSTLTHALLDGSPALDAGDNCVTQAAHCGDANIPQLTTDQRGNGFNRIVDGPDANSTATVDIGGYEKQAVFPNLVDSSGNEDATFTLGFEVTDSASITSITATSSNTTLVPNDPANIVVTGTGTTRTLTINPAGNLFGASDITVTVNRTGGPESVTFTLTVNPVNDAPSFTKGADQSVNENSAGQSVSNWATSISPGPTNEAGQTLSFQVVNNSNPSLFSVGPAITPSGTLTFTPAAGMSGSALITLALMDNGGTANGGDDTSDTQTFNINVLEGGSLQFVQSFFSVGEDGGTAVVTVSRFGGTAGEARVDYATSDGLATAGQDYVATSGTLIFPDGITSQTFSITITNDTIDELNETINLTLSNAAGSGALGFQSTASLSIFDNDPQPSMSIGDVSVTEGSSGTTNAVFTVTLSAASSFTVAANFATADGSAVAPSDYLLSNAVVTFNPGELTKTVSVTVNGDTTPEGHETFLGNLTNASNAFLQDSQGVATILSDDAAGGTLSFSSVSYNATESAGVTTITVNRSGNTSAPATVDYTTVDEASIVVPCSVPNGLASSRCDFIHSAGTLRFAPGDATKTFAVLINQDNFVEGPETLGLRLSNPTGGAVLAGSALTTAAQLTIADDVVEQAANPIDSAEGFVRQHYHDFLNRDADPAGLAFWINQIESCGTDAQCIEIRRINVSAAFYLSIEFQETGYLVERMYKVAYGSALGTSTLGGFHQFPVPVVRLAEFLPDTQEIGLGVVVGQTGWEQALENNKESFATRFVQRTRFTNAFPTTMTESQFVDRLNTNAGGVLLPDERIQLITDLSAGTKTRAQVVRIIAEDSDLVAAERNRAFVLMQYFGYLRRNPNESPDSDHTGYEFWLNKLNEFGGNFVNAEMVKAFITSGEYRERFGN